MMAKRPVAGRVKTRLATSIGPEAAAEVSKAMLESLMIRLAHCGDRRVLAMSPDDEIQGMRAESPGHSARHWIWCGQGSGDLGCRMKRRFQSEMQTEPSSRVVMVGSDLPSITPQDITGAFERLGSLSNPRSKEVVLGPAIDGGYWLIGLAGPWQAAYDALFDDMTWSVTSVFEETIRRASDHRLRVSTLETREDIDTAEALFRLIESEVDVSLQVAIRAALDSKN
jgi:uncharacterized protein